ncbi:MAG: hypothetical protein IT230_00145 [Flavobacteriales bacterium]|nr:hypothetical protein [Flavobacteriales bacterium]
MSDTVKADLADWFTRQGFTAAKFTNGIGRVFTTSDEHSFSFKLRERPGYATWHKQATGGSLIVVEVMADEFGVKFEGYCPLLLFGIWERKLSFKPDAGWPTRYRAEGWCIAQALQAMLQEHGLAP